MRDPQTIKDANDAARDYLLTLSTEGAVGRTDITVALAWREFLANKRNRRGEPLKNSTRQDYQSIYDNYILGAFDTSHRPLQPQKKEPPPHRAGSGQADPGEEARAGEAHPARTGDAHREPARRPTLR